MSASERLGAALADRYRIERELGAGGMATVYLAEDLKHDRDVAIKVMHPDLGAALGGERFLAEIKTTAKLQHPHILPLLDSGAADGLLFYVMPLVEGETLRVRLEREKQLPIDAAVRIATEVAGALDYAHRHGVIHRDIKPENILLHDGRAVVADFGIALAVTAASGARMTQTGLSLGTPQYMSPEQATGEKLIDARADVYALGAVLYEMLTGEPPFSGATVQAIVAKVLTERPMHPTAVRDTIPRHIEATLLKALAKLPADRFADAAKFAEALANPGATAGYLADSAHQASAGAATGGRTARQWRNVAAAGWSLGVVALAVAVWSVRGRRNGEVNDLPVVRAQLPTGTVVPTLPGAGSGLALSPDGAQLVLVGADSTGVPQLFLHDLETNAQRPIPGTNFAGNPFFSPDGTEIGYQSSGALTVQSLAGGGARRLFVAPGRLNAGTWGRDSIITFGATALLRMSAAGGALDTLAPPPPEPELYHSPSLSPDGSTVFAVRALPAAAHGQMVAVSVANRRVTPLNLTGIRPVLVGATLTYGTPDGSLWAVSFDISLLRTTGAPRLVTQGISPSIGGGLRAAVNQRTGTVVFVAGGAGQDKEIAMLDRAGRATVVSPTPRRYRYPRFSPDGRRVAVGVMGSGGISTGDIWLLTLANGVMQRLTSDTVSVHAAWEADGRGLVYVKRGMTSALTEVYRVPVDGGAPPTLIAGERSFWEVIPTPDGKRVVTREDAMGAGTGRDIYAIGREGGANAEPIAVTRSDERGIALSPDGKWLAYASDETGASEVYIRRLDGSAQRWPVSRRGGTEPRWSASGEVFFRMGDSLFASRVQLGVEPNIAAPVGLFASRFDATLHEPMYDVSSDGKRFVVTRSVGATQQPTLMILMNVIRPK